MIYIGSDHAGFRLKEKLKRFLVKKGMDIEDVGAVKYNKDDDYPDYARKLAFKVKKGGKGILVCGTGQGMCIAANKVKGVVAAPVWNVSSAKHAKTHDNADIICMGSKFVSESLAQKIVNAWMNSKFKKGRHLRRLKKVGAIR